MYFLTAKSTKNSPTDAFAYFVPSNVRPPKRRILGGCANIHKTGALSLGAEQEQPTACVPGAGGWQRRPQARADSVLFAEPPQPLRRVFLRRKGLILLRPLNAGRRWFPRKRHADGFGATFCHQKVAIRRGTRRGSVFSAGQRSEHANKGCSPLFACSHVRAESRHHPEKRVVNRRILACSGRRTTDSPRARSGRLHSLVLAAPAQRGPEVVPAKATCGWFWCF